MERITVWIRWVWGRLNDLSTLQWLFPGAALVIGGVLGNVQHQPYAVMFIEGLVAGCLTLIALIIYEERHHRQRKRADEERRNRFSEIYARKKDEWFAEALLPSPKSATERAAEEVDRTVSHMLATHAPTIARMWRDVEEFELWQAACLWVGEQPNGTPGAMPLEALPVLQILKTNLKKVWDQRMHAELSKSMGSAAAVAVQLAFSSKIAKIGNETRVSRSDLLECAKLLGAEPFFLFPGDDDD